MESERIALANEIKVIIIKITNKLLNTILNNAPKDFLPIPVPLIESMKKQYLDNEDSVKLTETLILKSHCSWDSIADRKEDAIFRIAVIAINEKIPFFAPQVEDMIRHVMVNRKKLIGDLLEKKLWDTSEVIIKKCIQYTHLKRAPKPNQEGVLKYTCRFAPTMSVSKESAKWKVTLNPEMN